VTNQIARLSQPDVAERFVAVAARLVFAKRIYWLGLRARHVMARPVDHVSSLLGDCDVMPDAIAGMGRDSIGLACSKDLVFAVSVEPSGRATMNEATRANTRAAAIATLMFGAMSSLARVAGPMPTDGRSFFHSLKPTFAAVAEALHAALRRTKSPACGFSCASIARVASRSMPTVIPCPTPMAEAHAAAQAAWILQVKDWPGQAR
jgi:DNA-binding MurR/RpiR family transcriptional regulator